jgi:hypothetical protein
MGGSPGVDLKHLVLAVHLFSPEGIEKDCPNSPDSIA